MEVVDVFDTVQRIRNNVHHVIVGKEEVVDLLLVALFTGGHVLLEDVPGTGKTLIAKTLAKSIQATFRRVQFTPDLLPSDLSGIHFYNQKQGEFEFRRGPVFTNILLADELNRATPRTQSSLLEAMEERQVSLDGETYPLAAPFMVIATQNPIENQGTYPLPEAQLDRFMLRIRMGYPNHEEGLRILKRFQSENPFLQISPAVEAKEVVEAAISLSQIRVSEDVLDYLLQVVEATRNHPDVVLGISPRGSQALLRASQAYAMLQQRDYVIPEDIKGLADPVLSHRLIVRQRSISDRDDGGRVLAEIVNGVPVPTEDVV
ncbi:AAA family ATPase [Alicyclobacillus ferrooxydans]|uniref:Magnesium chelatase n=1 Tax=Alicyclobacillus ferrooxydans TaxID=471514 RepID=A0A0P9CIR2_9BACL|nr:MoxR family ATPase [Alicyclobacillus ferrooxydans]KPV45532.1 magnesium chelatase [Alicyclobacillus ferrooxydans]